MNYDGPSTESLVALKELALKLATKAHNGQKRWDDTAYINHPIAVAQLVDADEEKILGLLHDVLEECPTFKISDLDRFGARIVYALGLMSLKPHQDFTSYLTGIKSYELARKVKIADLRHNISDLLKYKEKIVVKREGAETKTKSKKDLLRRYEASLLYLTC